MTASVIALTRRDGTSEFECIGCGVHVCRWGPTTPEPPLCAVCQALPGWREDERLRRIFGGERR